MANYKIIARQISWGGNFDFQDYYGKAVASEEAFYLVVHGSAAPSLGHVFASVALLGGPAVFFGALIAGGIAEAASAFAVELIHHRDPCEFDLSELPSAITGDPTWPAKEKEGRVIVIPRAAVESLYYPWWGPLKIYTEEFVFCLQPNFFLRGRGWVIRTLRSLGWKI